MDKISETCLVDDSCYQTKNQIYRERIDQVLEKWIDQLPYQDSQLTQAMRYGLLLGGKRARPFLVYATGEMLGASLSDLDVAAAAIECIHAYSLIHDDLPAMDDDDLRRGHQTCHVKFGEATAILAGDALQTLAFTILTQGKLSPLADEARVLLLKELSQASGAFGMCMGQALDLEAETQPASLAQLKNIHQQKTGALIKAATFMGSFCAGKQGILAQPQLEKYANAVGLAFQVQDDILDITGNTQTLGKPQGSDIASNKSTYPSLLGLEGAILTAQSLIKEALEALEQLSFDTSLLEAFAQYVIKRTH